MKEEAINKALLMSCSQLLLSEGVRVRSIERWIEHASTRRVRSDCKGAMRYDISLELSE